MPGNRKYEARKKNADSGNDRTGESSRNIAIC